MGVREIAAGAPLVRAFTARLSTTRTGAAWARSPASPRSTSPPPHVILHELGHHAFRVPTPIHLCDTPDATLGEAAPHWLALRDDREARRRERRELVEPGCFGLRSAPLAYETHAFGGGLLLDMLAARIGREALESHLVRGAGWADLAARLDPLDAAWLDAWLSAPAWPRPELVDGLLVDRAETGLSGEVTLRWDTGELQTVALGSAVQPPPGATTAEIDPELRFLSAPDRSP